MCSPSGCWLSPPRTDSRGSSTRGYGAMTAVRSVKEPGRRLPADGAGTGWVRTALRAPLSPTTPWSAWARTDGVIDCWQILGPQRIRNTGNAYAGPAATVAMAKGGRYSNQARICIRRTQGGTVAPRTSASSASCNEPKSPCEHDRPLRNCARSPGGRDHLVRTPPQHRPGTTDGLLVCRTTTRAQAVRDRGRPRPHDLRAALTV